MRIIIVAFLVFVQAICIAQQGDKKSEVKIDKLIETSNSWDGATLPNYPKGQPVITIRRYTLPPHTRLAEHYHPIINCGVVLSGELTIVTKDGKEQIFRKGDALVEIVGANGVHYGENRGDVTAEIIMFYAGEPGSSFSIKP